MPLMAVAARRRSRRHRDQREILRHAVVISLQTSGADTRVRARPNGYASRHRAILCVLVVIDEDAVAFFPSPLARSPAMAPGVRPARERQGGPAHLVKRPLAADADVDAHPARSQASSAIPARPKSQGGFDHAPLAESDPSRRPAQDRDRLAVRRDGRRHRPAPDAVQLETGQVGYPDERRRVSRHDFLRDSSDGKLNATTSIQSVAIRAHASDRRTRR